MPILIFDDEPVTGGYREGQCTLRAINAGADFFPNESTKFERLAELP
jgi:hypothetical protein